MSSRPSAELGFTCAPVISACSSTRPFSITATWRHSAHHGQLVRHDDDGHAQPPVDVAQHAQHRAGGFGIQRGGGLVAQQHRRFAGQRASDGHALLAAGQLRRMAGGLVRQPISTLAHPRGDLFAVAAAVHAQRKATFSNTVSFCSRLNCWKIMPMFWRAARSADLPGRSARCRPRTRAVVGPLQQVDQAQQRGLAGAALADDAEGVAGADRQRHVANRVEAARRQAEGLLTASSRITGWGTAESGESVALWVIG